MNSQNSACLQFPFPATGPEINNNWILKNSFMFLLLRRDFYVNKSCSSRSIVLTFKVRCLSTLHGSFLHWVGVTTENKIAINLSIKITNVNHFFCSTVELSYCQAGSVKLSSPHSTIVRELDSLSLPAWELDSFTLPAWELESLTVLHYLLESLTVLHYLLESSIVFRPCPPPLGLMFLLHKMTLPTTLDNPIPQNIKTLGKYTD